MQHYLDILNVSQLQCGDPTAKTQSYWLRWSKYSALLQRTHYEHKHDSYYHGL